MSERGSGFDLFDFLGDDAGKEPPPPKNRGIWIGLTCALLAGIVFFLIRRAK